MEFLGLGLSANLPNRENPPGTPLDPGTGSGEISLTGLEASGYELPIPRGANRQIQLTGLYSNSTNQNITDLAVWTSNDPSIVSIAEEDGIPTPGMLVAQNQGVTTVRASFQNIFIDIPVTVTDAILTRIEMNPNPLVLPSGYSEQVSVVGIYSDSSTQDLTNHPDLSFSTPSPGIVLLSGSGMVSGISEGSTQVQAEFLDSVTGNLNTAQINVQVTPAVLTEILITPGDTSLALGLSQQWTATGIYSDGSNQDLTAIAIWESSNPAVADFYSAPYPPGRAYSLSEGTTVIRAELNGIISNSPILTVSPRQLIAIEIFPKNSQAPAGIRTQFSALGTFTDQSTEDITDTVTWSSSDHSVGTISNAVNEEGEFLGIHPGSVTIQAAYGSFSDSTSFTVSPAVPTQIQVVPANASTIAGATRDYSAIGTFSNGTVSDVTQIVIWESSDPTRATLSNSEPTRGRLSAIQAGSLTVTATFHSITGSTHAEILAGDTTPPTLLSATSISPTRVRLTYSEPVNSIGALNLSNYVIRRSDSMTGVCNDNSNFLPAGQTSDFTITGVTGSGSIYELELSASQVFGRNYTLVVNRSGIFDLAIIPNQMGCSNFAGFEGQSLLRITGAQCQGLNRVVISFSKPIRTGIGSGSAECNGVVTCSQKYRLVGSVSLGNITNANVLDGVVCGGLPANPSAICLSHSLLQNGSVFTIIGANGIAGDGFDDGGAIRDSNDSENLQSSPRDRASFSGCGVTPLNFADGAIATDPFGDGTSFGFLTNYNGQLYLGPNEKGNSASRFNYDGTNPQSVGFTIEKSDSLGENSHRNTATSRDGGIDVPPFVSMGHQGCQVDSANLASGCGPDNENGRGNFAVGSFFGQEYLFLGGARNYPMPPYPRFNYLYYSNNTGSTLNFKWIFLGNITGDSTEGTQSFTTQGNRLYAGFAKLNEPSNAPGSPSRNTPDFGYIRFSNLGSDSGNHCILGENCNAGAGGRGLRFRIDRVPYFGGSSSDSNDNRFTNFGLYVGVDSLIQFRGRIYGGNGGHHLRDHNGGLIRSGVDAPGACTGKYECGTNWLEITPRSHPYWHGPSNNLFSIELRKASNFTPGDHAIAQFAEYRGKLFMTRTVCQTTESTATNHAEALALPAVSGCSLNSPTQRRPQLWKCTPELTGDLNACDPGDWSLVADNGSGFSNFGYTGNHSATLLVQNGSYLYYGLDNESGAQIWRTNIEDPGSNSAVWERINTDGFGDPANMRNIFSAISVPQGGLYFIYISAGRNGTPLRVFRQQNN